MLRYFPTLVLLGCPFGHATAEDFGRPQRAASMVDARGARRTDARFDNNHGILDPTGDLLPPLLATRSLSDDDYFEWCLRWNKRQYELASERAVSPRRISGWLTNRSGYARSERAGRFFGSTRTATSYQSTTQSRRQVWYVGGYGGGPVEIYNPFVPPIESRRE